MLVAIEKKVGDKFQSKLYYTVRIEKKTTPTTAHTGTMCRRKTQTSEQNKTDFTLTAAASNAIDNDERAKANFSHDFSQRYHRNFSLVHTSMLAHTL